MFKKAFSIFLILSVAVACQSPSKSTERIPAQLNQGNGQVGTVDSNRINEVALEILLKSSSKLATLDGQKVFAILAQSLLTGDSTHNKISNTCVYDVGDSLFKCSLVILNSDDKVKGRTESSTEIDYQLERTENGLPSDDLFITTVQLNRAG